MSRFLVNNFCTYCSNFERNPSLIPVFYTPQYKTPHFFYALNTETIFLYTVNLSPEQKEEKMPVYLFALPLSICIASLFGLPSRAIDIMILTSSGDAILRGLQCVHGSFMLTSQTNSNLSIGKSTSLNVRGIPQPRIKASIASAAEVPGPAPRHSATIEHLSGISGWLYSRM